MSLIATIKAASLQARKERNAANAALYSTLLGDIQMVGKNNGNRDSTDAEAIAIIKKFVTNVSETIKVAGSTPELENELALLSALLPKQMSEEDLKNTINEILTSLGRPTTPKDMGLVMKQLKEKHEGLYDGTLASTLTKALLSK